MELRVLVVCPDQDAAAVFTPVLAVMGIGMMHTSSISQGLQLLDEDRFDAIIVDYRGDESSKEFLARLRQSSKNSGAMLIAIVDGEFEARPVFGLGAKFALYRPLSLDRTRLSLQAARGLMRRERRRSPRSPVSAEVNVSYPGAPDRQATLNDISDGGTSISARESLPEEGKVYFEFALPGQQQLVRLSGEVAWQDSSGRFGIRFLDVPQASRRLIQSFLKSAAGRSAESAPKTHGAAAVPNPQPREPKTSRLVQQSGNRRTELRFPCKIGAEVYQLGNKVRNYCSLTDISEGGCYVEMPTPLNGHSGVEIVVRTRDMKIKIQGQVLAIHPGFGMGVRFIFRDPAERAEIMQLLGALATGNSMDEQPR